MLRSAEKLKGSVITATDGAIGEIDDLYFDDAKWTVRYLVVSAGAWLLSRRVLISPISITRVNEPTYQVFVNLTKEQVKNSPDIDTRMPVSRQHETAFMDYYGYHYYWDGPYLWGDSAFPATLAMPPAIASQMAAAATSRQREVETRQDEHLRSVVEVRGYKIKTNDGEIGQVDDFIVDDEDWVIRSIVIKSGAGCLLNQTRKHWRRGTTHEETKNTKSGLEPIFFFFVFFVSSWVVPIFPVPV